MGLDMYLKAKKYISKYSGEDGAAVAAEIRKRFGVPESGNLETVELSFEVGYWRKANQIHKWFVENVADGVDDCREVYASREQLQGLLDVVDKVLKSTKLVGAKVVNGYIFKDGKKEACLEDGQVLEDHTLAEKLLPCQSGFFFGGTGYDQWYWQDLESTKEIIEAILKNPAMEKMTFSYQASW